MTPLERIASAPTPPPSERRVRAALQSAGGAGVGVMAGAGLAAASGAVHIDPALLAEIVRAGPGGLCVLLFLWLLFVDRPQTLQRETERERVWAKALLDERQESRDDRELDREIREEHSKMLGQIVTRLSEIQDHVVPGRLR